MKIAATLLAFCLAIGAEAQEMVAPPTDDAPQAAPSVMSPRRFRMKLVEKPVSGRLDMAYLPIGLGDGHYHRGLPCVDPEESIPIRPEVAEFRDIKPCSRCLPGYVRGRAYDPGPRAWCVIRSMTDSEYKLGQAEVALSNAQTDNVHVEDNLRNRYQQIEFLANPKMTDADKDKVTAQLVRDEARERSKGEWVSGYLRADGTFVQGYWRRP